MSPINERGIAHEAMLEESPSASISKTCSDTGSLEDKERSYSDLQNAQHPSSFDSTLNPSSLSTNLEQDIRVEFKTEQEDFEYLLENVSDMILDYYDACGRPTRTKIYDVHSQPHEIIEILGDLKLQEKGGTNDDCLDDIRVCFRQSLKTMHPFFFDKLYFGTDPIGQIAELVVAVLNGNTHVYHVSPVFSVMEVETIQFMGQKFGFSKDEIDGTMNPGGSMSNTMALLLARNEHFPHVKRMGWCTEDRPVAFTAVQSHYSVTTAATVTGMGTDNMIQVPANRTTSQMDPIALNDCIQVEIKKGNRPFFVNAVAGSTVMGSFDDLKAIGEICKQYGLWFHVDACWGGFLIFASSEYQTDRFRGVELADSISFNPHKGLGVPQQCSMLITHKKKEALRQSNGSNAEYLFQPQNSGYDIGNKTLGCGRKADALKLWLTIRKRGLDGFRKMADNELKKAARMKQLVDESDDFEMVANPMGTNVCFWYTPKYFRQHAEKYTNSCKAEVHKLIFNRMKDHGNCLIQQNPLTEFDLPNFFRLALGADRSRLHDMDYLLEEIRRLGQDITCSDIDTKFL